MQTVLKDLTTKDLGKTFFYFEEVSSTNDYLKENGQGLPHGTAVVALRQFAGKGRTGRKWEDTAEGGAAKSLALSVLLKPPTVYHTPMLPLVCGLAVKKALMTAAGAVGSIKWPNDIVINGRKVCGILCEGAVAGEQVFTVCGIGVNLLETRDDFNKVNLPHATSVYAETGRRCEVLQMAAAVLNALEGYYERFILSGFDGLMEDYREACITLGSEVTVLQDGIQQNGTAVDIAPDGALLVNIEGKLRAIHAGEASVRGLYGYV